MSCAGTGPYRQANPLVTNWIKSQGLRLKNGSTEQSADQPAALTSVSIPDTQKDGDPAVNCRRQKTQAKEEKASGRCPRAYPGPQLMVLLHVPFS